MKEKINLEEELAADREDRGEDGGGSDEEKLEAERDQEELERQIEAAREVRRFSQDGPAERADISLNHVYMRQAYTDMNSKKEEVENLLSHLDSRITETHERVTNASQEAAQVPVRRSVPVDGPPTTLVFINGWVWMREPSFQAGPAY